MARSVRHLTGIAALLAERGIDLAGRFTFHMLAVMDEMLADLISEGTKKAWPPPGPQPGRRPQAQALCPAGRGGQGMYAETGSDGKRRYAVDEVAGTFAVSRKSICGTVTRTTPSGNRTRARGRGPSPGLGTLAPSSISSASAIRTSPRRSAPGAPATDGNSNPNGYVPPTALAPRTDSGSCTNPRHGPACSAPEAGPGFREDELAGGGQVWPCSTCSLLLWMRAT